MVRNRRRTPRVGRPCVGLSPGPGRCHGDSRIACVHVWRSGLGAVGRVWRWRVRWCPRVRGAAQLLSSCPLCAGRRWRPERGCSSSCSAYGAPWCTCAGRTAHTGSCPADLESKSLEQIPKGLPNRCPPPEHGGPEKKSKENPQPMATHRHPRESYFTYGPARAGRRAVHLPPGRLRTSRERDADTANASAPQDEDTRSANFTLSPQDTPVPWGSLCPTPRTRFFGDLPRERTGVLGRCSVRPRGPSSHQGQVRARSVAASDAPRPRR